MFAVSFPLAGDENWDWKKSKKAEAKNAKKQVLMIKLAMHNDKEILHKSLGLTLKV